MAKTWQVILATIGIFVAGLLAGAALTAGAREWWSHKRQPGQSGGLSKPGQGPQFGPQLIRRFADQLDLTPEQKARIGPIVKRTSEILARTRREAQLTSALAIERMQGDVANVLTPEQRSRFEGLLAEQRARLQQFMQERAGHLQGPAGPPPEAPPPPK